VAGDEAGPRSLDESFPPGINAQYAPIYLFVVVALVRRTLSLRRQLPRILLLLRARITRARVRYLYAG
jgi:hypothetical protein